MMCQAHWGRPFSPSLHLDCQLLCTAMLSYRHASYQSSLCVPNHALDCAATPCCRRHRVSFAAEGPGARGPALAAAAAAAAAGGCPSHGCQPGPESAAGLPGPPQRVPRKRGAAARAGGLIDGVGQLGCLGCCCLGCCCNPWGVVVSKLAGSEAGVLWDAQQGIPGSWPQPTMHRPAS
jgi:hypothetical protein